MKKVTLPEGWTIGDLDEEAGAILEERGIDPVMASEVYRVFSAYPKHDSDDIWVGFPHLVGGEMVSCAMRTIGSGEKKFFQLKGGKRCFWNLDVLSDSTLQGRNDLIIAEGHIDALTLASAGHPAVLSIPDGVSVIKDGEDISGSAKYTYVNDAVDQMGSFLQSGSMGQDVKPMGYILAVDNDEPGQHLYADLVRMLGMSRCKFLTYPDGCKDVNDIAVKFGQAKLTETVNRADWHFVEGLYKPKTLPPMPQYEAVKCGVPGLDEIWRFRPGEITILIGTPGAGKSTLMNQVALALMQNYGWSTVFASFEQPPRTMHLPNLIRCYLGRDPKFASKEEIDQAEVFLDRHVSFIWPSMDAEEDPSFEWLKQRIVTSVTRDNARLAVVDPMSEVADDRPIGFNETQWTKELLRQARQLAMTYAIHLVLVVHPRKPSTTTGQKPFPPLGYDADGSAHYYNKADVGMTAFRPDPTDENSTEVHLICWKARDRGVNGKIGTRKFGFNAISGRIALLEPTSESPNFV